MCSYIIIEEGIKLNVPLMWWGGGSNNFKNTPLFKSSLGSCMYQVFLICLLQYMLMKNF